MSAEEPKSEELKSEDPMDGGAIKPPVSRIRCPAGTVRRPDMFNNKRKRLLLKRIPIIYAATSNTSSTRKNATRALARKKVNVYMKRTRMCKSTRSRTTCSFGQRTSRGKCPARNEVK